MTGMRSARWRVGLFVLFLAAGGARATPITITVDTSGITGDASLIFDLINGGDTALPPFNSVFIYNLTTDGTLGVASPVGAVTGTLPGTLLNPLIIGDAEFFNEYAQGITLGTFITFTFDTTGLAALGSDAADGFSASLVTQSDPSGLLFLYSIGNANPLELLSDAVTVEGNGVPEPGVLALAIAGALALGVVRVLRS